MQDTGGASSPLSAKSKAERPREQATARAAPVEAHAHKWKLCLQAFKDEHARVRTAGLSMLGPVGRFWVLKAVTRPPGHKQVSSVPAPAHRQVELSPLAGDKAVLACDAWLAESNADLFSRWESSLEEVQRSLLEVFCWRTFSETVQLSKVKMKRTLRPMDRS